MEQIPFVGGLKSFLRVHLKYVIVELAANISQTSL